MNLLHSAIRFFTVFKNTLAHTSTFKVKFLGVCALTVLLAVNVFPAQAIPSLPSNSVNGQGALQTASTTFIATEDSYVSSDAPSTNYGSLTALRGDGSPDVHSYLRFNVQGLSGSVTRATLRIFANSSSTGGYDIRGVSDTTWSELSVTYSNAPAMGSVLGSSGGFSSGVWTSVDVTAYVTGNGTYNLALAVPGSTAVSFASREAGANAPQLVIETGGGAATPTTTSTPTLGPTQPSSPTATATTIVGNGLTFTPAADSYVESKSKSKNYGSQNTLRIDGSPIINSYLRFNVQGLSGVVTNATLRLYSTTSSKTGYDVRAVSNNSWVESSITYNNAPSIGNVIGSTGGFNSGVWTNVNVTSYVTGNGTFSLALTESNSSAISFASRESGANAPQLLIQTASGSGPTPTRTPTAGPTSTLTATPAFTSTSTPTPGATSTRTATPSSGGVVMVGAGDISTCSNNNDEATAKLLDGIPGTVFVLGDNVYDSGTYTQYTDCYDPTWGRHKSRTQPVPGNHEYNTSGASGYYQYFNNIAPYYAYNVGSWRIYALNSEVDVSSSGAQMTWLQQDLAANPSQCVMAYWHKPRWSSGNTHGSNSSMQTMWQVLYNAGAEIVLNGHEHNYERFAEMNASGSAVADGSGLREFVVGTGGMSHYSFGSALSASQVRNNTAYGVLKLTLSSNGYSWQFVPISGSTFTDSGSGTCH